MEETDAAERLWSPNADDQTGVLWETSDDAETSQRNRLEYMACRRRCAAPLDAAGVTDLTTFYDRCVLDGGDVTLETSSKARALTADAAAAVRAYAAATDAGARPVVRCSRPVAPGCDVWNQTVSRCLDRQSRSRS